jgi:Tfp pilus assembly protein PilW
MSLWRSAGGVSLAELLVSLAVLGLVLAGIFGLLHGGLAAYGWGAGRVGAQQAARVALERIAAEMREAGYDPKGVGLQPIVVAAPALVTFQRDLNGNGIVDPTRERVTFVLRSGETVLRRDAGAGAQPIIDGVRRLSLSYFDRAGAPTTEASRVTSVRIQIEVGLRGPVVVMETQAAVRNRRDR